jgi:acetyl-CoA synthetase
MVGTYTTLKYVFDIRDEDRFWCAADPGWITGHSYIVYGPLLNGATSFMYEGAPTFPFPDRWWSIVEKYGVSVLYTTPTAIRGLMRFGPAWPNRHDLTSLRLLGTVGEPINPEAWRWYHKNIGKERCPIMDTWWQTETGMFMITPMPAVPLKPGSGTLPYPGVEADVVDEEGKSVKPGEEGFLVLKKPWPAMLRTIYKDPDRYVKTYWSKYPGMYLAGVRSLNVKDFHGCRPTTRRHDGKRNRPGKGLCHHPSESRGPVPERQGLSWIPAFAGMTTKEVPSPQGKLG